MKTTNILVLYYSAHQSTANMARHIGRGVESVPDAQANIRSVPPVSPLSEQSAPSVPDQGAPYVQLDDLIACDGLAFGSPGYFGNMSAASKYFLETTTALWLNGELRNKPAALFTSTSTQHGGQESVLLSMMPPLLHHGMLLLGIPYAEAALSRTTTGGTPYGASHVSGHDGKNAISDDEITLCKALGKRLATVAQSLHLPT